MTFEYKLSKDDYCKAIKIFTRRFTKNGKKIIYMSYFAALFLILTSLFMLSSIGIQYLKFKQNYSDSVVSKALEILFSEHYTYFIIILVYVVLGVFFLYIATTFPDLKTKKWANNPDNSQAFVSREVSFTDLGLTSKYVVEPINEKIWKWSDFQDVHETSDYLLFELSNKEVFILPKSLLDHKDLEKLIEMIKTQLSS
ncbi:YcxB family protein [Enterococcus plantarum]|uniref:YcxB family protein n=1 Tax=Enterococcus plantarum TaxID=1077675 RepID=UPI001A8E7700|nr:YcxB family protein [Enterococcus plantarum]MBO0465951.1 YcxB family protein [Enterococcus plantarum]